MKIKKVIYKNIKPKKLYVRVIMNFQMKITTTKN